VTAIFTDISDLKEVQELQQRAERLESVAALSASLAHEIRNPLASIRSAVEQLARGSRNDPDEKILGDLILRESDRLSRLLGEFLDFSRVRATVFRPVNLHSIVTDAVRMVREHPDGIGVNIKVIGGPTVLQGDEDLLHRVVWNLVLNAAQAQKGSGKITVSIDQPPSAELPRGSQIDPAVRLRVVDQGPGIDPDLQDRVFEPFVSGRIGGTGLGLAIVQRAVESHRGLVLLDSAPGQGTSFTILLHATLPTEERA
jgi:two-component system sensor histidine kinase PilS (NtrC family)